MMERRLHWVFMVTVGLLMQAGAAYAYKTKTIVKAENKEDFTAVAAAVRQQMVPGGRYEFVDKHERAKVDAGLSDMQSLFDKYDTVAKMSQSAKVQLFNDQETVNAILTRRDDKRLICESIAPVGSHIPRTTCRTYREVQLERRGTRDYLQRVQQVPQYKSGH